MTLLFCDSFDHYATADIGKKWGGAVGSPSISAGNGRNGSQCLRGNSAFGYYITRAVSPSAPGGVYIFGFAFNPAALPSSSNAVILQLTDANNTQCGLTVTPGGALAVTGGSTGTTTLGTSASAVNAGAWHYVEAKFTIHNSAGAAVVRVDGDVVLSLSGVQLRNNSSNNNYADTLRFGGVASGSGGNLDFDDFYHADTSGSVNNDFLGDVRIEALYPSGAGATTAWTPSTGANYAAVDEALGNTTDYVTSTADDQVDTYAFGNLAETSGSVKAVQLVALAQKTDTAVKHLALVDRTNGANHANADQALSTSWAHVQQVVETDAGNGGIAWTIANVNAAEFGVKSRA